VSKSGQVSLLRKLGCPASDLRNRSRNYAARIALSHGLPIHLAIRLAAGLEVAARQWAAEKIGEAEAEAMVFDQAVEVAQEMGVVAAGGAA
jgi:hypothetical protein